MILYDEKSGSEYEEEFARTVTPTEKPPTPSPPATAGVGLLHQYLQKYRKSPPSPIRRESDQSGVTDDSSIASPLKEGISFDNSSSILNSSPNVRPSHTGIHSYTSSTYQSNDPLIHSTSPTISIPGGSRVSPPTTTRTLPSPVSRPGSSFLFLTRGFLLPEELRARPPASVTAPQQSEGLSDANTRSRHIRYEKREGNVDVSIRVRGSWGRCEQEVVARNGSMRLNLLPNVGSSRAKIRLKAAAHGDVVVRLPPAFTGVLLVRISPANSLRYGSREDVTLVRTYPNNDRLYFMGDVVTEGYLKGMSEHDWAGNILDLDSQSGDVVLWDREPPARPGFGGYLAYWLGLS